MERMARLKMNAPSSRTDIVNASSRERSVGDAGGAEVLGGAGDPFVEDLGGGLAQGLVGAGDLQGDGGDGAGVGVVGVAQRLGGAGEEVGNAR